MHKYKNMSGEVVITFSVTDKMKKLAEKFNLPCRVTKIGFKYIAELMIEHDILVGGEESGGLAVKGHIPERDGIWMGLCSHNWNVVFSCVFHAVCSGFQIPFSPRRDDFHIRSQCFDSKFETNLVITFTSRTVSDSISAFFFSDIYKDFTD